MKDNSGAIIHLVKLIDTADTSVRKNEGATFQHNFFSLRVFCNVHCQTDSRGALTWGIDTSRCDLVNILQQLTLGSGGITAEKDVNLASESTSTRLRELFGAASKKLTQNTLFDILILPNGRGEGVN